MDRLHIQGGQPLQGTIRVSGSKNAGLPLLATCLLTGDEMTFENVPDLADMTAMATLLARLGVEVRPRNQDGRRALALRAADVAEPVAPYELVRKMRASILVLGPLLARFGLAQVSLPGGCAIGTRPVDLHLKGLSQMGAEIELANGYIVARAPQGLRGARITFPKVSVGATENLLMAATLARGETELLNAAREPEIEDLARCLTKMGAEIEGAGTDCIRIQGVARLMGVGHRIIPDRIEAGTYAMAAAITDGDILLEDAQASHIGAALASLQSAGLLCEETEQGLRVRRANGALSGVDVMTEPFPGFPTDLQAQMMALMTVAEGASMITETIFENRFMHVPELGRLGANITVHGTSALVRGVKHLVGAPVMATDLRASVSLVMAGLSARGETVVNRIYHLDRGYEDLVAKLAACGALIERRQEQPA
ncbi:MAG TPA: UDP-N-acetylglucosamine 1-carboxyvinyltransferase [Dongiaceae bacterium]|jgi:UDP-N-acetylglucosamine 1-carboxyvinyltransferase|nr:UDP-N-acetylglucosamine 1-carboxyvinyltransferase [Dongiaceae bacterium]